METVIKLFLTKQAARVSDGEISEEEYQAIIDGVNDALAYLHLRYDKDSDEIQSTQTLPLTFEQLESKYSKMRLLSAYKSSFLRANDIAKYSGAATPELQELADKIRADL